jgi:hypothetical protein
MGRSMGRKRRRASVLVVSVISEERPVAGSSLARELWQFMRVRKKFWLLPLIIMMFLIGALLVFAQGSALAPFIYTIF